ncbi:MAG: pilus assembly protein [Acidobacteria bacterium]|nr:pilus assembly protein [Acidobacteriota bacterium]
MDPDSRAPSRWKSGKGQTLAETAIVLILLLMLTFAIIDFALIFYAHLTLEHGIAHATRYAITGQLMQVIDPITGSPVTLDRRSSILKAMQDVTPTLDLSTASYAFENITNPAGDPTGGPGDVIKITVSYDWRIVTPLISPLFPNGKITLTVSSTSKNEPSPGS